MAAPAAMAARSFPGLKYDPDELVAKFGAERGARLVAFAGRTADAVFDLIAKHRMDVPHVRNGWIQGAHSRLRRGDAQARVPTMGAARRAGRVSRQGGDRPASRHHAISRRLDRPARRRGSAPGLCARALPGGAMAGAVRFMASTRPRSSPARARRGS